MSIDFSKMVKGELTKCIVRVKPPTNFQKEDVRINGPNIVLTDPNGRCNLQFYKILKYLRNSRFLNAMVQNLICSKYMIKDYHNILGHSSRV